ncbi:Os10g0427300 [Oryza sativa Japonica Group]|uniref:Os10g0427300 protein n=1 Tax=Oryza sativa subsp. japonica TaxID=39947 RepID=C7J810_ORYSJ|nr:Os10g0427300 [Oryza sativa Japonica Group]|eukprot:NP_001176163.1 Os10g0427300 [Oryza sativa Japonica Group]
MNSGSFSLSSAYNLFFLARTHSLCGELIWQTRAPSLVKFFMWSATKGRCITADNLQKRGWPHHSSCSLCQGIQENCHQSSV